MEVITTPLAGLLVLEPRVFRDERGRFMESWNERRYAEAGIAGPFVQDNVSVSHRNVLRGLHYQDPHPQGKLITVLEGTIWDVGVDLRPDSPTYAQWYGTELSAENGRQMWLPPGFAHGFVVTSERAICSYKCTSFYNPAAERTLRWDDASLAIEWPVARPVLSEKDRAGENFRDER